MHRGSSARRAVGARAVQDAGRLGAEAHASRLVAPDRRAGASLANFRKWFSESGLLCDAFTPASLDVLHATCRAPGSGDEVTWGEFLRALARAAELLDAPFGAVRRARRRPGRRADDTSRPRADGRGDRRHRLGERRARGRA